MVKLLPKRGAVLVELCQTIEKFLPEFDDAAGEDSAESDADGSAMKQVLDSYVAPAIAVDGGAIRYHFFDKASGILTVDVLGSCHGCPSLVNTLKRGIEPMIKDLFPQVTAVIRLKRRVEPVIKDLFPQVAAHD